MKVIIFGATEFAKQMGYYLTHSDKYELAYFCVNKNYYTSKDILGKKVLVFEEELDHLSREKYQFLIAVGYKQMRLRKKIFDMIKEKGFTLINYIHPTAIVMGNIKGEGNIILSNVVIEPFAEVNHNNIIWSNALVCHDSQIGDHNFIAAKSLIGGFSKVIDNNFIGFNSVIKENIVVDKEILIGANSLVLKSPDNYSVNYGVPAVKIKEHIETGINL